MTNLNKIYYYILFTMFLSYFILEFVFTQYLLYFLSGFNNEVLNIESEANYLAYPSTFKVRILLSLINMVNAIVIITNTIKSNTIKELNIIIKYIIIIVCSIIFIFYLLRVILSFTNFHPTLPT